MYSRSAISHTRKPQFPGPLRSRKVISWFVPAKTLDHLYCQLTYLIASCSWIINGDEPLLKSLLIAIPLSYLTELHFDYHFVCSYDFLDQFKH